MTTSVADFTGTGMTDASRYLNSYRAGGRSKVIHGYPYGASTAPPMTDAEKADKDRSLPAAMLAVRRNWDESWLPEIEADLSRMKAMPDADCEPAVLWQAVEQALKLHIRHWFIHHRIVLPVIEQSNRLGRICDEILGRKDESVVSVLLHGTETMTVKSIRGIERLAASMREDAGAREAVESSDDVARVMEALAGSVGGQQCLGEAQAFLLEFGYRCAGFDLSFPTWIEDKSFLLQIVRSLLRADADDRSDTNRERLAIEQQALLKSLRDSAADRPDLLERFEEDYALAQQIWPLKEDHSHYIDQASTACVRIILAEVGRRLAANGSIEQPDDIWHLDLDEAKRCLLEADASDVMPLVRTRRSDRERFSKITPPKFLGTMPADREAASEATNDAVASVESGGTLRGSAASKGEASGVARVVLSPDDFHKVRNGDVLVCRSTAPMWTPLFKVISALVSEAGGVLSHPAVVAREFNLPAVVGVQNATSLIRDGQIVTVSGTDGLVHVS